MNRPEKAGKVLSYVTDSDMLSRELCSFSLVGAPLQVCRSHHLFEGDEDVFPS